MDISSIDALLQRFSAAESRIGANLHELAGHSSYQILRTDDPRGVTARKLGRSLARADALWEMFNLLQSTLDRARTIRSDGRLKSNERRQLAAILTGPSIEIARSNVPLHQRGLTDSSEAVERVTIEELLSRMRALYEPIRDGVAEVDTILRSILPRLDAADTTLQRVGAEAQRLGIIEPELSKAVRDLDRVRRLSLDDPLALDASAGDDLDRQVRLAAGKVGEMKKGHDQMSSDMGSMAGLIAEIRTLRARAAASREEAIAKIASPVGLVHVPSEAAIDGPDGLSSSADSVTEGPASSWVHRRSQLDEWLTRARRLRDQLHRAEERNRAPLTRRDELRGLLRAYRAKMAAMGHAEDAARREIADEAHNELYTSPSNLARAETLLRELGSTLSGTGGIR